MCVWQLMRVAHPTLTFSFSFLTNGTSLRSGAPAPNWSKLMAQAALPWRKPWQSSGHGEVVAASLGVAVPPTSEGKSQPFVWLPAASPTRHPPRVLGRQQPFGKTHASLKKCARCIWCHGLKRQQRFPTSRGATWSLPGERGRWFVTLAASHGVSLGAGATVTISCICAMMAPVLRRTPG